MDITPDATLREVGPVTIAAGGSAYWRFQWPVTPSDWQHGIVFSTNPAFLSSGLEPDFQPVIEILTDDGLDTLITDLNGALPNHKATTAYNLPEGGSVVLPPAVPWNPSHKKGTTLWAFNPTDFGLGAGWYRVRVRGSLPGVGGTFRLGYQVVEKGAAHTIRLLPEAPYSLKAVSFQLDPWFADLVDNSATIAWDFGDGDSASSSVVEHTYRIPGIYTVLAQITTTAGTTFTATTNVVVYPDDIETLRIYASRKSAATPTAEFPLFIDGFGNKYTPDGPNWKCVEANRSNLFPNFGSGGYDQLNNGFYGSVYGAYSYSVWAGEFEMDGMYFPYSSWMQGGIYTPGTFGQDGQYPYQPWSNFAAIQGVVSADDAMFSGSLKTTDYALCMEYKVIGDNLPPGAIGGHITDPGGTVTAIAIDSVVPVAGCYLQFNMTVTGTFPCEVDIQLTDGGHVAMYSDWIGVRVESAGAHSYLVGPLVTGGGSVVTPGPYVVVAYNHLSVPSVDTWFDATLIGPVLPRTGVRRSMNLLTVRNAVTGAVVARQTDPGEDTAPTSLITDPSGTTNLYPVVATDLKGWVWVVEHALVEGTPTLAFPITVRGIRYNHNTSLFETDTVTLTDPDGIALHLNENAMFVTKVYGPTGT